MAAVVLRAVIGDVLRRARTSQGRTLREVSNSARVSLGYLSEVERGRKEASSELLSAICAALDVPLSRVLCDAGTEMACQEAVGSSAALAGVSGSSAALAGVSGSSAALAGVSGSSAALAGVSGSSAALAVA